MNAKSFVYLPKVSKVIARNYAISSYKVNFSSIVHRESCEIFIVKSRVKPEKRRQKTWWTQCECSTALEWHKRKCRAMLFVRKNHINATDGDIPDQPYWIMRHFTLSRFSLREICAEFFFRLLTTLSRPQTVAISHVSLLLGLNYASTQQSYTCIGSMPFIRSHYFIGIV